MSALTRKDLQRIAAIVAALPEQPTRAQVAYALFDGLAPSSPAWDNRRGVFERLSGVPMRPGSALGASLS